MDNLELQEIPERERNKIERILGGVYHAHGGADHSELTESDGWMELGEEEPSEKAIVNKKSGRVRAEWSLKNSVLQLNEILHEFWTS